MRAAPPISPLDAWIAARLGRPLTRAALERYQLERLQATVAWAAAASPFYRERLRGVNPKDLTSLSQVAGLPFTLPADLRAQGQRLLCLSQSQVARVVTLPSSGTSGPAKCVFFTDEDLRGTMDFFQHGMSTFTQAGDAVLILLPGARPDSVGDLLARALERLGARPLRHGPVQNPAQTVRLLVAERARVLVASPVQALALLRGAGAERVPPGLLASVLLTTDYVPQAITQALERAWACRVFAHWGLTESGLGGGVECEARQGYHLREADLYVEVVDPASGAPLAPGQTGEVALTTLTRRGMPLIRFRTGDLAALLAEPCPCGSLLRRLGRVSARRGAAADLGQGKTLTMAELDEALFPLAGLLDFRAALEIQEGRDLLAVELIPARAEAGQGLRAEAGLALRRLLASKLGTAPQPELRLSLGQRPAVGLEALTKRGLRDRRVQPALPASAEAAP